MRVIPRAVPILVAAVLIASALAARPVRAEGRDLTGRLAPDMTFSDGMNGVGAGTSLSSFRGKVVWVKFVLRDCPRCRASLPRAQEIHDRWGGSGLVVLAVVYQHGAQGMQPFLTQNGYTFRVATDGDGSQGRRYGLKRMPTDYVIGVDGRVRSSNGAPDTVLRTELGRYRLARLGAVPPELSSVRDAVWNWDYGSALRTTEALVAKGDASAEVRAVSERLRVQARDELDARIALAALKAKRGNRDGARAIYDRVAQHFAGTSLESAAAEARAAYVAQSGGR